jgi:hypothetical protein
MLLLQSALFSELYGQSIVSNYGAPASALNVCAGPSTFNVQLNGGVSTSGTLNITLPAGYVYAPNSHAVVSGGLIITQSSASNNLATLQVSNIPAGTSEFSYQASASCGTIGASGSNQVTYKLGNNPDVLSNPVNALNAKLNITNITNNAYIAAAQGATYTRAITIQNGGFGAVNELNLTSTFTGLGIGAITTSAGSIIITRSLVGTDSVINVKISPAGGTFAPNATVMITESVTVTGCAGGTTAYDAWYGCPDKCTQGNANGTATAGATINASAQPSVIVSTITSPDLRCLPTTPATGWTVFQARNTGGSPASFTKLEAYLSNTECPTCTGPVGASGYYGNGGNTCASRTMYLDTAAGVQYSTNGGATWTNVAYNVAQWYNAWPAGGGYHDGKPIMLHFQNAIPQLNAGDSVRIRFKVYDEIPSCCTGDWYQPIAYFGGNYTDACGNNPQTIPVIGTDNYTAQRYSMNSTSAADAVAGQPYYVTFEGFILALSNSNRTAGDGYVDYELTLPTSLAPSLIPADNALTKGALTKIPDNVTWDAVTRKLRLRFLRSNLSSVDFTSWKLSVKTTPDCAGTGGTVTLNAYAKLAACAATEWQALCNKTASFTMHGCPIPCLGGFSNYPTKAQRTNYGIYSSGNNGLPGGTMDTSMLNLEGTVYGDTVAVTTTAAIATGASFTNAYVSITKSQPDAVHAFVDAKAYIYNGGSLTATITGITAGTVSGTNPSTRTLDIKSGSGAPATFGPGDSVIIVTRFRQLLNDDVRVGFTTRMYTSNSASPTGTPQFSCDDPWTGTITNYGVIPVIGNYQTLNFSGCNTPVANQTVIQYITSPTNPSIVRHSFFPNEIRQFWSFDSMKVVVPTGFTITNMKIWVNGQGATAVTGIASYPVTAYDAATNTYYYNISTLANQLLANGVPFSEGMQIWMEPTYKVLCKTGNFPIETAMLYIHSKSVADNTWNWYGLGNWFQSVDNSLAPLNMTSASPNVTVNGNTTSWEIQVSNPTTVVKPNAWIAKATGVSTTTITSVQELTGAGGTVVSTANIANGIYQLGSIPASTSKYYRVNATFTNCIADSIKLGYDFNCDAYPASIIAGEAGCRYKTLVLKVNAQPTGVQTTIISQPPSTPQQLCATLPYEVEIRNPALGTLMDTLILRMQLPTGVNFGGVQFVPGSAQVQVPNASYPNGAYTVLSNTVQSYEQVSGVNFLIIKIPPATLPQLGALEAMRVKFEVRTTSCDFVSGSSIKFRGEGRNACDETIFAAYQQAQSVRIAGAPVNPILFILNSKTDSVTTCAAGNVTTQYRFSMINNGPATTDTNYKFRIALPAPWTLDVASLNFAINTGTMPVYVNQTGGFYNFKAGANLAVGDSIVMTATLTAPSAQLSCGISSAIKEEVLVTFSTICIVDTTICADMRAITSEREETVVVVARPTYSITALNGTPSGNPPNHLAGTFTLQHNNATYTPQNGTLKVYKDVNQDGVLDGGDVLLGSQVYAIANLASQTFSYDIVSTTVGNICPVIATMEMDCVCEAPTFVYNCNSIVLPIKFKDEKVTANACQVNLSWNYEATETIVTGFTIERLQATNGGSKWDKIGTTPAHVTRFTDITTTGGKWLYRIKATSTDNDEVYSRTLSVNTTCLGMMVKIFPNPANDVINIAVLGGADQSTTYSITDNLGRAVKQGQFNGNNVAKVNIHDLAGGLYQVRVVYGGNVYVQQIDIVK